jgi:hypothetical protein
LRSLRFKIFVLNSKALIAEFAEKNLKPFTTGGAEAHRIKLRAFLADREGMDLSSIALQGLAQAEAQLEEAASGLASAGAASPSGANLDTVDLSTQILALLAAQNAVAINVATLKTVDQIQKNLIDIKA